MITQKNKDYIAQKLSFPDYERCLEYPKFIELETIRACNARCTFCAVDDWDKIDPRDVIIKESLFEKFLKDINENAGKVDTICLCRDGEPLLDKKIAERIKRLKDLGVNKITLSTNGQLLTENMGLSLINAGLDDMMFSIDAATEATFNNIRQNLDFQKVVNNALLFIELRNRVKPEMVIRIRMVVTKDNQHEVGAWKDFWSSRVSEHDLVQAKEMHNWGNQLQKHDQDSIQKYSTVPCIAPFNMFVIHSNGHVVMCGHDFKENHIIGDFNSQSIKEIWHGPVIHDIRVKHLNGERNQIQMCRGCNIWDRRCL